MRYEPLPDALFAKNRLKLKALLKRSALAVLHSNDVYPSSADGVLPFRQLSDLYYLTGIDQEETVLLLFPEAVDPLDREILFIKETDELLAIWEGQKLSKTAATCISSISRVEWLGQFNAIFARLALQAERLYLVTNEHQRAAQHVETRNDRFIKSCQAQYPLHRYERLAPLMHRLRMIKEPEEISVMKHACEITEAGFRRVLKMIRPGVGEWEIEAEWVHEFIRRGSRGFAYAPIIGSGANACILHYTANDQRCRKGDMLLMDVAAEYAGWASDLTRTVPVSGRFTKRQRLVYDAVYRVMRATYQIMRPGIQPAELQREVVAVMEQELIGLGLFSNKEARGQGPDKPLVKKYFMHGISHHLGLDVHDVASPNQPLAAGMVFTIEPGIYIREEGLGIRLENDVLVGEHDHYDLMQSIPIEAEHIEECMNA